MKLFNSNERYLNQKNKLNKLQLLTQGIKMGYGINKLLTMLMVEGLQSIETNAEQRQRRIGMAKTWNKTAHVSATQGRGKKTSQGRGNVAFSTMNKNKKSNFKKYRGQGK